MFSTLDGWPVSQATVQMPSYGAWYADIEALASVDDDISGTVSFILRDVELICTVIRGGLSNGIWKGRVVGGLGKLSAKLSPKYYKGATALLILKDALKEAGEKLSGLADVSKLNTILSQWTRISKSLGQEIESLLKVTGGKWRILEDGTVWIGEDSRKAFTGEYLEVDLFPEMSKLEIIPTSVSIFPGMMIQNQLIDRIIHQLTETEFTTEVYFGST